MQKLATLLIGIWSLSAFSQPLIVQDDFEGNGTIDTWVGDDCALDPNLPNPVPDSLNPSATVLEYRDTGGQYANARFDVPIPFDLGTYHTFSLKVYVPASGLTGNAPQQVSLKLQNGTLPEPWTTQTEIIKPLVLDQWQTLTFDFGRDPYVNLDANSPPPTERSDFNRVLIQLNGENNNDQVLAYLDDLLYPDTIHVPAPEPSFGWLVWADEFEGNGPIDTSKWFHQTLLPDGNNWYNGEIQHYTDRIDNAFMEDGLLHILAKRETFTDQGVTKQFTSARLNSTFAFTYGRVEVRAKLPFGPGTWPALWTLGQNIDEPGAYWQTQGFGTTPWPACGEIDIMEHWGTNPNYVSSATHTPSSFGGTINTGGQVIPTASTAFHLYSLEWSPNKLVFAVDGNVHFTHEPAGKDTATWPFDAPQYLIFNLAILPTIAPGFTESALEIDYVRVYQEGTTAQDAPLEATAMMAYPNPVKDVLHLSLPASQAASLTLELYDAAGRQLRTLQRPVNQGKVQLSVEDLPSGLYLLRWEEGKQGLRFVKE